MQIGKWIVLGILCFSYQAELINASIVINNIPPGGMTISTPGTYVFENDITWSPSADGQAILITASDVILDLQNYELKSTPSAFSTTGILAIGSSNLNILNGTIANMRLGGITCDLCLNTYINNITVDGLTFNDIVNYTVPTGILFTASTKAIVNHCKIKNIDVTTGSTAGIQFTATTSSLASNCLIQNMINHDGACTGIGHLLCNNGNIISCIIDNLQSEFVSNLNTAGHTTIGIIPVLSTNLLIKNCNIFNITGCCDDAHGLSVFECDNALVKNCRVNNILDGVGPTQSGAKATGIEIYGNNIQVIKCSATNIKAINPQDKQASGFACAQCKDVQFIKCHAANVSVIDENGNESSALGYGTGFGWAPDPRPDFIKPAVNVLYKHCTAENCQVGFDSWYHINSRWRHIHSICNGISVLDLDNSQRTISCDACSECGCSFAGCYPTPYTVTLTNIAWGNKFSHVHAKYCN